MSCNRPVGGETLESGMKFDKIKSLLPDYAKDIKLNLSSLSNIVYSEKNTLLEPL